MVIFHFQIDDNELKENLKFDLQNANIAALQKIYLTMPVELHVNGFDIFRITTEINQNSFLKLPILDLALNGWGLISNLKDGIKTIYHLPEGVNLYFVKNKMKVHVSSNINNELIQTNYQELCDAFRFFRVNVKKFLLENIPNIEQHINWVDWF